MSNPPPQAPSKGSEKADIAVIGAGPVGLFAVFQCGMLELRCSVIDALEGVGGQCSALYPEKPIYDIPGFPQIPASGLIENLERQAAPFDPVYHLNQQVTSLTALDGGRWLLETSAGTRIDAGAVLIAAGVGAFGPNRPPLDGLESFEGTSVFYLVNKREDFRGKNVVIAGGGDSAVDWALSLVDIAASIKVVHRRPKFRAAPESARRLQELADAGTLELVIPFQLDSLEGKDGKLEAVGVRDLDGTQRKLEADVLLPFFGLSQNLGPVAEWGLDLDKNHIVVDAATMAASRPGLYAIGDIAAYPGKLKLILTGFAEAALAAHSARAHIHPGEVYHFEYSTTHGVPEKNDS
ncbi:MAG: NAD(P)/FAD-dependent oxidoreductase [Rhodospirillales bacterium]|nr:NAD(P)/FAD-dependent oxidoreductase [Rhodospirillales bacterium]